MESQNANPHRSPSPIPSPELERSGSPDIPLTMTASAVLTHLPPDATTALEEAGKFAQEKVVIRFKPVGSAPMIRRDVCKVTATQKFEAIVAYLRRSLQAKETDSVFLYINSTFAPALDEIVGNLHQCFKDSNDQLIVSYAMTPAFG
ncbi:Ubiquitin-like protein ATG12 [Zalerion maritima]|uniref:Ubiquitin-like protein ATG12 n=1 Tax=Zalerion maritima TaxID=339359 RepID=A0AAD5RZR0_9PEZI|nr:Ubiquitin-like protein ATG12 [Zalerion maritima]